MLEIGLEAKFAKAQLSMLRQIEDGTYKIRKAGEREERIEALKTSLARLKEDGNYSGVVAQIETVLASAEKAKPDK